MGLLHGGRSQADPAGRGNPGAGSTEPSPELCPVTRPVVTDWALNVKHLAEGPDGLAPCPLYVGTVVTWLYFCPARLRTASERVGAPASETSASSWSGGTSPRQDSGTADRSPRRHFGSPLLSSGALGCSCCWGLPASRCRL